MTNSPGVWLSMSYADAPAAISFLSKAFGFEVSAQYDNADDSSKVDHAELLWPLGGGIMLGSARESNRDVVKQGSSAYVVTDEPDALYERAIAAGAVEVRALNEQDYGSREFAVSDPEGNIWSFGTYRGHQAN
ncbi:MAG: VOC family protein [Antricoccus sp.]